MRTWICAVAVGATLAGCDLLPRRNSTSVHPPAVTAQPRPVNPQEITAENAHQKAQELKRELDREAEQLP
ncbi:MAG: hypothetical protein C4297_05355 [Gemmataceae bacterium]